MRDLSTPAFDALKSILTALSPIPNWIYFAVGFVVPLLILAGGRLTRFTKPDSPFIPIVIRALSKPVHWLGVLLLLGIILLVVATVVMADIDNAPFLKIWDLTKPIVVYWLSGSLIGLCVAWVLAWRVIPKWERGEGLHNVADIIKNFMKKNGYDPLPYINIQKGCFVGLNLDNKPIYIAWQKIRETHIEVIGTTGCGKGVVMTLIAYQTVLAGERVIWFDPKFDRFSPRILADAAKKAQKTFCFINLNPEQPPQLNPLAEAEAFEIEELLVSAFDLKGKGTDGDFHRGKDEDAAIQASRLAVEKGALSIPALIQACRGDDFITKQENFWRKLCKLGDLDAIKTQGGINLKDAILSGSVIYIVGSSDNERVKMLQKLLLVRISQIIKKQDRLAKSSPTCIVLDEFKHVLSPTALTGLGVIRDFDAHCLLAHQSLGDLDSCAGISRAEAEGAVLDNTAIKIVYRLGDSSYAEKLSKNSGKKSVFIEQAGKNINEHHHAEGSWREAHVPLIDPDVLTHLPMPSDRKGQASMGVLFGINIAKIFYVGHIPTKGSLPSVKAAPAYTSEADNGNDWI